ncbi:hypothetical protein C8R47DRAFT_1206893 [Mycena vitilis]|nr:hypothetical protein C8R47DRAFT_1206893 [Mycena vitilis]
MAESSRRSFPINITDSQGQHRPVASVGLSMLSLGTWGGTFAAVVGPIPYAVDGALKARPSLRLALSASQYLNIAGYQCLSRVAYSLRFMLPVTRARKHGITIGLVVVDTSNHDHCISLKAGQLYASIPPYPPIPLAPAHVKSQLLRLILSAQEIGTPSPCALAKNLQRHMELLNEHVKSCPIEAHDNVGFMICSTEDLRVSTL